MAKGYFTQGVVLLCERAPTVDELSAALSSFEIVGQREAAESWTFGGRSVLVAFRPEVNGFVTIDTVGQRWPDHMGDPKKESMIFGAWSMGNFGPYAFPGGLARAGQQCWSWEPGKTIAERHQAFVRIRLSYAFGAQDDDPIIPADCDAVAELEFVTRLAAALLAVPGTLCYFNPNGEVLKNADDLRESLNWGWSHKLPPLDAWSNVRLFNFNQEWSLMDTVGNAQLDMADVECIFARTYEPGEIDRFLRNASLYLLKSGPVIKDNDTMDGPGNVRWQARSFDQGIIDPPRQVVRFLPQDGQKLPPEVAEAAQGKKH
jgi:hypothetical protein